MKITEKLVRKQLKRIIDPELDVSIVDLGLIYDVKVRALNSKTKIKILMTLTTPACPLAGMFDALVKNQLKKIEGLDVEKDVEIELTFDPPWTQEMMTEELKIKLGF